MMCKTLHGMTPEYLRSRFVYLDNVNAYYIVRETSKIN